MKKGVKIGLILGLLAVIGVGTWVGVMIYAAKNIEYSVKSVSVEGVDLSGSILDPKLDVNLSITLEGRSPTGVTINVKKAEYAVSLGGIDLGGGETDPFKLIKEYTDILVHHRAEGLSYNLALLFYDPYFNENNKTLQITILKVKAYGVSIKLNVQFEIELSKADIDELTGSLWGLLD